MMMYTSNKFNNTEMNRLSKISYKNEIDYYTNENNITNQKLVQETIQYFHSGDGARLFKPLDF